MDGFKESHRQSIDSLSSEQPSIFQIADECDKLFDRVSREFTNTVDQTLASALPNAIPAKEVSLAHRVGEFHSRFRAWASYLGVFAGKHMNLDARLRDRLELSDIFLLTLDSLKANLQDRKRFRWSNSISICPLRVRDALPSIGHYFQC